MITELFLHGCMFQALRQFGDDFAVISTSILAAALTHNLPDAFRIGLVHLLISCYLIYTGSFCSAAILRMIHEIYMFALFYIESSNSAPSVQWWIMMLIPCVICTCTSIYLFLKTMIRRSAESDFHLYIPCRYPFHYPVTPFVMNTAARNSSEVPSAA